MRVGVVSRFGRRDVARGGGISRTATLTVATLRKAKVDVRTFSDKATDYSDGLSDCDAVWLYTTDQQIETNILPRSPALPNTHLVVNSAWAPGKGREKWMRHLAENWRDKFPLISFSVWSRTAKQQLELAGFEERIVHLPHLQMLSTERPSLGYKDRRDICVGEVDKLQRSDLTTIDFERFVDELRAIGCNEPMYAYGQYSMERGALPVSVNIVPKMPFQDFMAWLGQLRVFILFTNRETFAAPPIEAASRGVVPLLPGMPQSLDDYFPPGIPRFEDATAAAEIVARLISDEAEWTRLSSQSFEHSRLLDPATLIPSFLSSLRQLHSVESR
jgi:glycosyltransferase involved in cell wall biosynthesis